MVKSIMTSLVGRGPNGYDSVNTVAESDLEVVI